MRGFFSLQPCKDHGGETCRETGTAIKNLAVSPDGYTSLQTIQDHPSPSAMLCSFALVGFCVKLQAL